MLQNISISINAAFLKILKKKKQHNFFSTLVNEFTIILIQNSEGSCDTEDWINDAENSAFAITGK